MFWIKEILFGRIAMQKFFWFTEITLNSKISNIDPKVNKSVAVEKNLQLYNYYVEKYN